MPKVLRLVLGDQLSHSLAGLQKVGENDIIMLCEVMNEATYVKHHPKKIAFLFSAMRHFAAELEGQGHTVRYVKLDDADNAGSFKDEIGRAVKELNVERIVVTHPGEYRVLQDMQSWEKEYGVLVDILDDDRFLSTLSDFKAWAKDRKQIRMEYFYREMRKKYNILMDGEEPEGGKWNYDADNRQPPKEGLSAPAPYTAKTDDITKEVIKLVAEKFESKHFGDVEPFYFAVTASQAKYALSKFIDERLCNFGTYQDAMVQGEPWLFHAHLSFYLNCGLLLPMECIKAAEAAYYAGDAPLNAVEGFIRQILGWREYVRGIYWLNMPGYAEENFFNAKRPLPKLYWGGETKMNCLRQCVKETKENAYAHHIQRLMVLGNFALIAGLDVQEVNEWFLVVYADAYEWVEMPNVSGMILFADGGYLASKPYAAGGAYINKMSNYCKGCTYKVTKKNGPDACPFNYLYWDFLDRNQEKLKGNPRVGMMYKTWERFGEEKRQATRDDARRFFDALEAGEVV